MEQLKQIVDEVKTLKEEMMKEAGTLQHLKDSSRTESTRLTETMQEARRMRHTLQDIIDSSVQDSTQKIIDSNIQKIVDTKMINVEQAVHKPMLKRGKELTTEAKKTMTTQMEDQVQMLEARLSRESDALPLEADETFESAVGILDDSE